MQVINVAMFLAYAQLIFAIAAPNRETQTSSVHNHTVTSRRGSGHGGGGSGHGGGKGNGGGAGSAGVGPHGGHSSAGALTPGMTVWVAGLAMGTVVIGELST